jgi:hypothetical protein
MGNVNEVESLFHAGIIEPAQWLNGQGFVNVPFNALGSGSSFWSSTLYGIFYVWVPDLNNGSVERRRKTNYYFTWPVRGGVWTLPDLAYPANIWKTGIKITQYTGDDGDVRVAVAWPSPRFIDHGDGTATDRLTGLMWLKDANCFPRMTWMDSLNVVADFNLRLVSRIRGWPPVRGDRQVI